ncbi:MAG: molybdopterin oxidoreductase family protein, partial [Curvibacter sp.]
EQPAEWQTLLRLAAIARGEQGPQNPQKLDDDYFDDELKRLPDAMAEAARQACGHLRGPDRLLDLALRGGPYQLTLAQVQAAPAGLDLGELQPRLPELLRTPDGLIDLCPAALMQDLARAQAALREPSPSLTLIGRRDVRSNNSWMHNLPILAKGPERCTLLVHPADAQRLGLPDGSQARLSRSDQPANTLLVPVHHSTDMMPGVVSLPHGWGHDQPGVSLKLAAERPGVNLNALLDEQRRDPLSGNSVLSGVAVHLVAA